MTRIGVGAGFAADRFEPAIDLARRGELDFLVFEGLAERTLAYGHLARMADPSKGYNEHIVRRLRDVLPLCRNNGTVVATNMGAANPHAAAQAIAHFAAAAGLKGLEIAVVTGDDVTDLVNGETILPEIGKSVSQYGRRVVGANAYMGAAGIVEALDREPDVVVTGRVADPSLFLGPLVHRLGWSLNDAEICGAGTLVGHLLECSCQISGGYFADGDIKRVPDIAFLGYPLAEVANDGTAVITKLDGTGGCITEHTVKEQLVYEVHDPARYLTPDVSADFSNVSISLDGPDRIRVGGARGNPRPDTLKVVVGFDGGYLAEAGISYAGLGAADRARLAGEIVRERMIKLHGCKDQIRFDLIGFASLHAAVMTRVADPEPKDVRLRVAIRTDDKAMAETLLAEVEALWVAGPAGGGGFRGRVTPSVVTHSAFLPRELVTHSIEVVTA